MILNELGIKNFRNYKDQKVTFSDHINAITGSNAQGKTNLLEAVFFLSRGYSHRASTLQELVCFLQKKEDDFQKDQSENGFFLEGKILKESINHRLSIKYDKQKKTICLNGKKDQKQNHLCKILNTILFEPEDLRIVKAGPERRRHFMDEEIAGYQPVYQSILKQYKKVLFQRNALLKEIRYHPDMKDLLDPWDEQLVRYGSKLINYRVSYLKRLGPYAIRLHYMMSNYSEKLSLFYQSNVLSDLNQIQQVSQIFPDLLKQERERDIERGATGTGPHVDDIMIKVNDMDARKFCSQGQQRTAAIAMKLSQIDIYKECTGDYPIVLLDDILSELDEGRQEKILSILNRTQSFITCTDTHFTKNYCPEKLKIISVSNGHLTE